MGNGNHTQKLPKKCQHSLIYRNSDRNMAGATIDPKGQIHAVIPKLPFSLFPVDINSSPSWLCDLG